MDTYEKKYKEAINRAKAMVKVAANQNEAIGFANTIFPELAESEDERIKKGLIKGLSAMRDIHKHQTFSDDAINIDDAIAWLEKQGKQDMIPLDKVIKFLDDQLVNDKDEVTGEPFINFQNYGAFKESFISYFKRKMLEKQGEQSADKMIEALRTEYEKGRADAIKEMQGEQNSTDKVELKFKVGGRMGTQMQGGDRQDDGQGVGWRLERYALRGRVLM